MSLLSLLVFSAFANAYVIQNTVLNDTAYTKKVIKSPLLRRDDEDPADFSWVKRWAAVGDSYTAGLGAGNQLGKPYHKYGDWKCSRYNLAYPMLVNHALGPAVKDFQYPACSGARSEGIYEQVNDMEGNLNLVMLTAGGNDLCLAGIIKSCVFASCGEDACNEVLDKAQGSIDTILKPNLKEILEALDDKMADDSVVVYNGYAEFFNTENEDCADSSLQNWHYSFANIGCVLGSTLRPTVARRKKFNTLVQHINTAIQEVIDDMKKNSKVKHKPGYSNWDPWPRKVDGQMCSPTSDGRYPDPKQKNMQFFKPETYWVLGDHDELKRRQLSGGKGGSKENIYNTLLWKSPNPAAEALHRLDARAPSPPGCPGDNNEATKLIGMGLPDTFGRNFHPNELGHQTVASFALQTLLGLRAEVLGVDSPSCEPTEEFTCWQKEGRKGYTNADKLNENYKKYCDQVKQPDRTKNWSDEKSYQEGTLDEHSFKIQLSNGATVFDKDECLDSFDRIINSCDGKDPENPLNWKFGGRYVRGNYAYEVNIKRTNRPWPAIKDTYGSCKGWYKFLYSDYTMYGAGWSTYDNGQQTLLPSIKGCLGLGVTKWSFKYFDEPDEDGMEWKVTFRTPIWVRARCFNNNKVAFASGGFTDGCGGNDA